MSTLSWVRGVNGTLGWVAPKLVASKMRLAFMTPRERLPRDWELPLLARSERITLRFGLSALRWGQGPAVLLMHGWEGRPTQFASLIDALVGAGYSVVALDGPAHGRSPGHEANVMLFARAMLEAAAELPPLRAVIGHSMGAPAPCWQCNWACVPRPWSVSPPRRGYSVCCAASPVMCACRPRRARPLSARWSRMSACAPRMDVAHYQLDMPGLIVHAEDDNFVPVKESELIHEAWFDSRLLRLKEGGHQRVLADPRVIEGVLTLLAGRSLQARQSA